MSATQTNRAETAMKIQATLAGITYTLTRTESGLYRWHNAETADAVTGSVYELCALWHTGLESGDIPLAPDYPYVTGETRVALPAYR